MKARVTVADGALVLVDTNPIVYWLEGHPLGERFVDLFDQIDSGRVRAIVTPITLAEVLVGPLRAGNATLATRYRRALTHGPGFSLREMDGEIATLAAQYRATMRLKLPDAIQLATAVHEGCDALVTHDRDFRAVRDIEILGIDAR